LAADLYAQAQNAERLAWLLRTTETHPFKDSAIQRTIVTYINERKLAMS